MTATLKVKRPSFFKINFDIVVTRIHRSALNFGPTFNLIVSVWASIQPSLFSLCRLHQGNGDHKHVTQLVLRPSFFYLLFYQFFSQQIRVGGRNKNKNKIHSNHFSIVLKSKETRIHEIVFPLILIQLENGPNEFYFYFTN